MRKYSILSDFPTILRKEENKRNMRLIFDTNPFVDGHLKAKFFVWQKMYSRKKCPFSGGNYQ
jgi:hypothetical protein